MIAQGMLQERPVIPVQAYRDVKPPKVRFQLVTKQAELFASAAAWHELNTASASPEAMLDPAWLLQWWRHYGVGIELAVGMLYAGDELVGLAPLCIRAYRYRPGLVFRRLQFMGIDANESDGVCSEYMNFIARAGYEEIVARTFVDRMAEGQFGRWHEAVFATMKGCHPMTALIERRLAHHGIACTRRIATSAYAIALPATWDDYLKSLTVKRRYAIKSALEKFKAWAGDKDWRLEHATSQSSLMTALDNLMSLHGERWSEEGKDGAFSSPRFTAFHRDYATEMFKSGGVDIAALVVGGEPIAAIYSIRQGSKVMTYQNGRIMGLPPRVRVGIVINALLVQEAIARGDSEYDFMAGEYRYKIEFATETRQIVELRAVRPNVREYVRLGLIQVRDTVTKAIKAIRPAAPPAPVGAPAGEAAAEQGESA